MDAASKSDLLRFVVGLLPSMAPSDAVATMHALTVMGVCNRAIDGFREELLCHVLFAKLPSRSRAPCMTVPVYTFHGFWKPIHSWMRGL